MDETYVNVEDQWMQYLYRVVDSHGHTIGFLLSVKREGKAGKRFFRKALPQQHTVNPSTCNRDMKFFALRIVPCSSIKTRA